MDRWFEGFVRANPDHRFRVGNPDELRSNQMGGTLDLLNHRVNRPEPGAPEAVDGRVITVLNEEAAIGAVLGNKAGLNLAVSYEAFAVKMLGALRQDIIFARQQLEAGAPAQWLGVPLIATSHTWENGKNQQSHQDPTIGEALLGEMSDVSRVMFPPDAATAVECVRQVYAERGVIACSSPRSDLIPAGSMGRLPSARWRKALSPLRPTPIDRSSWWPWAPISWLKPSVRRNACASAAIRSHHLCHRTRAPAPTSR